MRVISLRMELEGSTEELAQKAAEAMPGLRRRAELLILPRKRTWTLAMSGEPLLEILAARALSAIFSLPIEADGTPNYLAFTRIGMVFTQNPRG